MFTLFFSRKTADRVSGFDETMGANAGTPWQAGEDHDYLLRALKAGATVMYDPDVVIYHPDWGKDYDAASIAKSYTYALSMGRLLRTHDYPLWFSAYYVLRPLAGVALGLLKGEANVSREYLGKFYGRLQGWMAKV